MINNLKVAEKAPTHFQNWLAAKRLQRRIIFGTKTGLAVVAGITAGALTSEFASPTSDYVNQAYGYGIESVTLNGSSINDLNLVMVNDGADPVLYNGVIQKLNKDGINFKSVYTVDNIEQIDQTETFVALTTYQGEKPKVIGQNEDRKNQADPLALGIQAGFDSYQYASTTLPQLGVHGYDKLVPSNIEEKVADISPRFVTVAVPDNANSKMIADSLVNGLCRFDHYITNNKETNLLTNAYHLTKEELSSYIMRTNSRPNQDDTILIGKRGILDSDIKVAVTTPNIKDARMEK